MEHPTSSRCAALIATAREVVARLPDTDLRAAFLFGSAAWGDADEASDLDLTLLLERPADYREVTRVRVADILGRPLPHGPAFADLDRLAATRFVKAVGQGAWGARISHSVVLKDTAGWYADLRDRVTATYETPAARAARWRQRAEQAAAQRAAMQQVLAGDIPLAALHARLALTEATNGLIELHGDRISLTHFVESAERALQHFGVDKLSAPLFRLLGLEALPENTERALHAYYRFAEVLATWMRDPAVHDRLPSEDRAWAAFTYAEQTYEEMAHKVAVYTASGRLPALQHYLDGLLLVVIRLNLGKVLCLRERGTGGLLSPPDFQVALRAEPALFAAWVAALRLDVSEGQLREVDALAERLLREGAVRAADLS